MSLYQLNSENKNLSQGIDLVAVYFIKLNSLCSEYDAIIPGPSCACSKSKDYADHLSKLRLI